jgi:hypothetical protein
MAKITQTKKKIVVKWLCEKESKCDSPHVKHACFIRKMQKLLKLQSEQEWHSLAEYCEIPPLKAASHAAALTVLECLWNKDVFHHAYKEADEIAILAQQGTDQQRKILWQKHYNKKPRGKRLEITVSACYYSSVHKFCLKVKARNTEISAWGNLCECGCNLRSSELKNAAQPQCRSARVSPVTLLCDLGILRESAVKSKIPNQSKLVQYFLPDKTTTKVIYVDFFNQDGSCALASFDCWTDAFRHATKRFKSCSWKVRDAYYKNVIQNLKDKITATGVRRGTLYVAHKKLLQANKSALWATYNVKECFEDVQLLAAAFAEFTDSVKDDNKNRRSMIRVKQANKTGEFHAIKWRDITFFDLVHLVTTENSNSAPSVEELHSLIDAGNCNVSASALTAGEERILLLERILSHRLCWLYETFECEWASSPSWSLTGMSYSAVMHSVHSDPGQVGLEQFGHAYSTILHAHNQGGLMFSSAPSMASGDALGPAHKPANALLTYDYTLHYPSALQMGVASSHFVRGYHRVLEGSSETELASLDGQKNHFFEYLNSFYVIAQFVARDGRDVSVKRVYTRYNTNGQIRVGGAGIDLVVVYTKIDKKKGRNRTQRFWKAVNMHHQ